METNIKNLDELEIFVNNFLDKLILRTNATIITLAGELGVGKTAFVKSAARYFGIDGEITSPTFVIQKEYKIKNHKYFKKILHIDAYRLDNKSELEYLKWGENILDPETIIFIEWPEQVSGINMPNVKDINIKTLDDETREITVS